MPSNKMNKSEPTGRKRGRPRKEPCPPKTESKKPVKKARKTKAQTVAEESTVVINAEPADVRMSDIWNAVETQNQDILSMKKELSNGIQIINETLRKTSPQIFLVNQEVILKGNSKQHFQESEVIDESEKRTDKIEMVSESQKFLYRTTQFDEKPKVLRKFVPEKSKYRKQYEASKEVKAGTVTKLGTESGKKTEATFKTEIEIKKEQPNIRDQIFEEGEEESSMSHLAAIPNEPLPISKFHKINAWLARQQGNRCVKYSSTLHKMLTRESLISTFKCMAKFCSYATISKRNFNKHLDFHEKSGDSTEFLYFCPYCLFEGNSNSDLIDHYRDHDFDKFQCGYCFYRSASDESCWEHCKKHHCKNRQTENIVYECPLEFAPDNKATRSLLEINREKYVKKIHCPCKHRKRSVNLIS